MATILVTGSNGLVGSDEVGHFQERGWTACGVDNNTRADFFGPRGDTGWNQRRLLEGCPGFSHQELDLRHREGILELNWAIRPDALVHVETFEGRELMSVGSGPWNPPGQLASRQLLATAPPPGEIHAMPKAVHLVGHHPHHAPKKGPLHLQPALTAGVTADPDANGSVIIASRSFPKAKVSLALLANGTIGQTTMANAKGQYQLRFIDGFGSMPVRVSAAAPGHKATLTVLMVNRREPPANHPLVPAILPTVPYKHYQPNYFPKPVRLSAPPLLYASKAVVAVFDY
jgi:hypothetical protein